MRVLFATTHLHLPQGTGGIEVTTHTLCKALAARGDAAAVLCQFDEGGLFGLSRRIKLKLAGGDVVEDRVCGYPAYRAWQAIGGAPEAIAHFRPDVVVSQGWMSAELAKPFLRAGIPTVISVHTPERYALDAELAAARKLSFVVNSRFTATVHADKPILDVIPPLIVRNDYVVESDRSVALFVNPMKVKGLPIVLDLARSRPDVTFEVFESWRMKPDERRFAYAACAELPNMHWRAAVGDMRQAYRRARLVLMPSEMIETWGRVASEGHINGIPTLASAHGALPDTVGPGGLCVPLDAPSHTWQEAFSALWDDPGAYSAYCDAAERHSLRDDIQVDQVIARFAGMLERAAERA